MAIASSPNSTKSIILQLLKKLLKMPSLDIFYGRWTFYYVNYLLSPLNVPNLANGAKYRFRKLCEDRVK